MRYPGRFVLGFHGCTKKKAEDVLIGNVDLTPSTEDFDWLGEGVYFWEHDYHRALHWAEAERKHKDPYVVGALIDLGNCLDLVSYDNKEVLTSAYETLVKDAKTSGQGLPVNQNKNKSEVNLLTHRYLDCAVIERAKQIAIEQLKEPFNSVRGIFYEGAKPYPEAGFQEKTHTQIAIPEKMIKGSIYCYFRPRELSSKKVRPQ